MLPGSNRDFSVRHHPASIRRAPFAMLLLLVLLTLSSAVLTPATHALPPASPVLNRQATQPLAPSSQPQARKLIVPASDTATLNALPSLGATLLADYGAFTLWQTTVLTDALPATATSAAAATFVRPDFDYIWLRDGFIDTRNAGSASGVATPDIPPALQQTRSPNDQFWLVQFIGPIKDEWLAAIQSTGGDPVIYMPNNAYLIWGNGDSLARLDALAATHPFIQWTGPYHPAYRLAPDLQSALPNLQSPTPNAQSSPSSSQLVDVTVQFYTTLAISQSLSNLQALAHAIYMQPALTLKFTNISLQLPADQVPTIATWPDVYNIEPWVAPVRNDEAQAQILAGNLISQTVGTTETTTHFVPTGPGYLDWLAAQGFSTSPENYPIVSVVDDGIDIGDANDVRHPDFYELGNPTLPDRIVAIDNCTGDTSGNSVGGHGNINAGIVGGYNDRSGFPYEDPRGYQLGLGIAPYGHIAGVKNFRNGGGFDINACGGTYQGLIAASFAQGAAITTNSWGSRVGSVYTAASQTYDAATRDAAPDTPGHQPMLHVFAAGNSGSRFRTIAAPGTGKNVLTAGATENVRDDGVADRCLSISSNNADDIARFSSRGPTVDGRSKPDLMAPGIHIQGPASQDPGFSGRLVCGVADSPYYPRGQTLYTWSTGTSHSTPAVAGAAAMAYEYYQRILNFGQPPSPAMLKALLINTSRYLTGLSANDTLPSPNQGWGDVNLGPLTDGTPRTLLDQTIVFGSTGQEYVTRSTIADPTRPLLVSLVWTDAPGSPVSAAYVNDLDLEITLGTTTYRGNVFQGAFSIPGGEADPRNNVENIFIPARALPPEYASGGLPMTVRVIARNISGDGIPGNTDPTDQDFALVIYNDRAGVITSGTLTGLVTDAATGEPMPGALIQASLSPTRTTSTRSGPDGKYHLVIPPGAYTIRASRYGYFSGTWNAVGIAQDNATTLNPRLQAAPLVPMSGVVRDGSGAGYPIHAQMNITAPGFTTTLTTDPITGRYQVNLAPDFPHTFSVVAIIPPGQPEVYHPEKRQVTPQADDPVEDFNLPIHADLCAAPGYQPPYVFFADFETDNDGFTTDWASSWQWGAPASGPPTGFSGAHVWGTNLTGSSLTADYSILTSPRIDLSSYSGHVFQLAWWQWLQLTDSDYSSDTASVEVSNNDGRTWTPIHTGHDAPAWTKQTVWLDATYATRNVRIRFIFSSRYSLSRVGYFLDNVGILAAPTTLVYTHDFEANDGQYITDGDKTSWEWGIPVSRPDTAHSGRKVWGTNLDGNYNTSEYSRITSPPIDLSAYTGQRFLLSWWQWVEVEPEFDNATVQISNDDGRTWNTLLRRSENTGWKKYSVWLDSSYATRNVRLRFTLYSDYTMTYAGFFIDDVAILQTSETCVPQRGGFVVGTVTDGNTGGPIVGATIASRPGTTTTAPLSVGGLGVARQAFYRLFLPAGQHTISAIMPGGYTTPTVTIAITPGAVVRQDFLLDAGRLAVTPPLLAANTRTNPHATASPITFPLTLRNTGTLPVSFTISTRYTGYTPHQPPPAAEDVRGVTSSQDAQAGGEWGDFITMPGYQVPAVTASSPPSYAGQQRVSRESWQYQPPLPIVQLAQPVDVLLLAAADVRQLQTMLNSNRSIGEVSYFDARRTTPLLADLRPYDVVIVLADAPFADPVGVGNVLADYIAAGGKVIQTAPTFYDGSGAGWGLQGRYVTEGYSPFIGTGDWHTRAELAWANWGHPIMRGVLGAYDTLRQKVDLHPDAELIAAWEDDEFIAIKGSVVALNTYVADGRAWSGGIDIIVHNTTVWLGSNATLDWLTVTPATGMLAPGSTRMISVTLDSTRLPQAQFGDYTAALEVTQNTPYGTRTVPVTMTIAVPPTWGKLAGVVTSIDACNAKASPLRGAQLHVEDPRLGQEWQLTTDISGTYQLWLDPAHNPLDLTVTRRGHTPERITNVHITAQRVITQNIELHELARTCPITDIIVSGQYVGVTNRPYTFTASVVPLQTTGLITYSWNATDHRPRRNTDRITDTVTYIWLWPGTKEIYVSANNGLGYPETARYHIRIVEKIQVFLPVVLR